MERMKKATSRWLLTVNEVIRVNDTASKFEWAY
jgi:hypothetical protein